jgi:glycosyltransferase involved in cell wall biosynthesis
MLRYVFVLEQTLGHAAHGRNLERVLAAEPEVEATIIRLEYSAPGAVRRLLPGASSWSFTASRSARAALAKRIAQGPTDAIFIHTQVASLLAVPVMRRIPTVISLDATPINFDAQGPSYGHVRSAEWIEHVKLAINRRAYAAAGALVTWSHLAARSLVRDYGVPAERVHVIRPGVDLDRFRPTPRRPAEGPVRILFVGGDFARKGGFDLLGTLGWLGSRIELDIVTASHVDQIPATVRCRVHRGLEPQSPALVDLYERADVFALPSRGDCLPQAIAEAMACGLPVVGSDAGAIGEMVRHGYNGFVVPRGSPRELARAIEALVEHPILRRAMGERSRRIAEGEHDANRNNRSILALMGGLRHPPVPALAMASSRGGS